MSLVEILDVTTCRTDQLIGFAIDRPGSNSQSDTYQIEIVGWVLGRGGPAEAVELRQRGRLVRHVAVDHARPDVAKLFPDVPGAQHSGFWICCGVTGLGTDFEIEIEAVLGGDARVRLGTIRGRHQPVRSNFNPTLQPLMVTSLGRTGTTWLMQLLSQHPAIVAHPAYPYEVRCAGYWAHMFTVLVEPANFGQSAHPDTFDLNSFWVGHHPFHSAFVTRDSPLGEWFGRQYVEDVAAFCQRNIENFYLEVAKIQGRTNPRYFAEKYNPTQQPRLMWELYPKAREIFLIRDFRDMMCSIFAFNARRGIPGFGRDRANTEEGHIREVQADVQRLLESWRERSKRAHLLRYEDLILRPEPTLEALFAYLDIDRSSEMIREILKRASIDTVDAQQHRTTPDPKSSIGRWRRELTPQLRGQCEEVFSDLLRQFGYPEDAVTPLQGVES